MGLHDLAGLDMVPALEGVSALALAATWNAQMISQFTGIADNPSLFGIGAGGALLTGFALAVINLTKTRKALLEARKRMGQLELDLNEVETALFSESQILLAWRSGSKNPDRVTGSLHGQAQVPESPEAIMDFARWLEADACSDLQSHLEILKSTGKPFNIGIKTQQGELLEADGRTAGAHATLRLRPLAGDRRQLTEMSYDASKLAKQVQRLSAILDSAPFPIWIKSDEGQLSWINQAYVAALDGIDMQSVLKADNLLLKATDIDHSKADPTTGLTGRGHAVMKGNMRAFNVFERPIDGGTCGIAVDVTPLEENEKELERHIKAHASTLDKLDTAIAIFGPDQHLRFFNEAYVKLWSLDENWLRSQPTDGEILDRLRAARALPEQANFREWRSKQLASYTTLEVRESYWYLPDGRSLHVVCEQHPFGGVTYLYENLTKEYQLESKYNELFDVQRETLDNLEESVALFGSDGRLKLYNPAFQRLWKLPAEPDSTSLHVDQLSQDKRYAAEARAAWGDLRYGLTGLEGGRRKIEGQVNHDGMVLAYRAVPLPDGNALVTFIDISDAARAEKALLERTEALEATDKLKSAFLAHVSYEVRTPLTSISGFAEALDLGLMGPLQPRQKDYVLSIRQSSDDLSAIIDAIIDLSAIDAGAMELKLDPVDVATLLETVAGKILPALERRNLTLNIEVAADITDMLADGQRLEQVLSHLLSNAIGFSKPGMLIRIGARRLIDNIYGDKIQIWVADQGRGIEPELLPKVFERFQAKSMPGGHRGPGLGLAIVKSFTELHGGTVAISSKLNVGTTVICNLPEAGPAASRFASLPQSAA